MPKMMIDCLYIVQEDLISMIDILKV
jgi:hypothetical protein